MYFCATEVSPAHPSHPHHILTPPSPPQVFAQWHSAKADARRLAREEADAERRKRGLMTGRELFQSEGFTIIDDAGAGDDADYTREDDEERRIQEMFAQAQANLAQARARQDEAGEQGEEEEEEQAGSSAGAAGPSTTLQLAAGDEDLFDDDDDDELGDDELQELESQLAGASLAKGS
jgi:hypothetical protein